MPRKIPPITQAQCHQVEALAVYLTQAQIADFLGMSRRTFQTRLKDDAVLFAQYKKGRAKLFFAVAQALFDSAMNGNVTAQIFYLKTKGGWRVAQECRPEELTQEPLNIRIADCQKMNRSELG